MNPFARTVILGIAYEQIREAYAAKGKQLPVNRGNDADLKGRYLDCLVINYYLKNVAEVEYQTVRCAFTEGGEAYVGAMFKQETHVVSRAIAAALDVQVSVDGTFGEP